ncbi:hypothetical protein AURDEDRAFT_165701 [Auricularia subglabra TFB-10046 SS5]|nr:hypothetical protein AURDEDRAFT_165701 [Auricularia subglabra TFB-10046 SS5]
MTHRTPVGEVHLIDVNGDVEDVNDVFQVVNWEQRLPRTASGDLAAHDSLPLMAITASIENNAIETIIDTGLTICCMSDRVWKKIGCPVYTEKVTKMRDANGNVAGTLSAVLDQAIVIEGLKFYTTIHVVPNTPFSLILGTPCHAQRDTPGLWPHQSPGCFLCEISNAHVLLGLLYSTPTL